MENEGVAVSNMKTTRLYIIKGGIRKYPILHRKLEGKNLECFIKGKWVEVIITAEILMNLKLQEY